MKAKRTAFVAMPWPYSSRSWLHHAVFHFLVVQRFLQHLFVMHDQQNAMILFLVQEFLVAHSTAHLLDLQDDNLLRQNATQTEQTRFQPLVVLAL